MICYRCGREMPDNSTCCKGCGTQLRRHKKAGRAPVNETLSAPVTVGSRTYKTWHILLSLVMVCSLLIAGLYLIPPLLSDLDLQDHDDIPEQVIEEANDELLDRVTGTTIQCSVPPADLTVSEEYAFADGKWRKDCKVDEHTVMRFVRMPASDNWMNTHLFQLYPDVTDVDLYSETSDISGYPSDRIQFSSQEAPGCIIQAVCVSDSSFDHIFIVEMPVLLFEENDIFVDEWINHLILADALTGAESINPAALMASPTDTLTAIEE